MDKRLLKRFKRENRKTKNGSWYCAGCKARHQDGERCPTPRLFAPMTRAGVGPKLAKEEVVD